MSRPKKKRFIALLSCTMHLVSFDWPPQHLCAAQYAWLFTLLQNCSSGIKNPAAWGLQIHPCKPKQASQWFQTTKTTLWRSILFASLLNVVFKRCPWHFDQVLYQQIVAQVGSRPASKKHHRDGNLYRTVLGEKIYRLKIHRTCRFKLNKVKKTKQKKHGFNTLLACSRAPSTFQ